MKLLTSFYLITLLGILCNCAADDGIEDNRSNNQFRKVITKSTPYFPEKNFSYWRAYTDDETGTLQLRRTCKIMSDSLEIPILISSMNRTWEHIQIEYVKHSKDTLYLKIPDSQVLTERIGTTGAFEYLAELTFNMTENRKVKYVNLNFEPGEHTSPKTWNREDFKENN